jgi:hypothetical protein
MTLELSSQRITLNKEKPSEKKNLAYRFYTWLIACSERCYESNRENIEKGLFL